jgi:hypothetical protein
MNMMEGLWCLINIIDYWALKGKMYYLYFLLTLKLVACQSSIIKADPVASRFDTP